MRRSLLVELAAAAAVVAIAGCSSSGSPKPGPTAPISQSTDLSTSPAASSSTSSTSAAPSTTPSKSTSAADPRVAAALSAYESFVKSYQVSERHPPSAANKPYVASGSFPRFSFDPVRADAVSYILFLTQSQLKYVGTAPATRASVMTVSLNATPYPTVTVSDCPTAPASWKAVATSGPPATTKPPKVAPPYRVTAQVIYYEKHWGVYKQTVTSSKTCSP